MKRLAACAGVLLMIAIPSTRALPVLGGGDFSSAPAGLLGCVASTTGDAWCVAAVQQSVGSAVSVHVSGHHSGGDELSVDVVVPASSVEVQGAGTAAPQLSFDADVPSVGRIHLVATTDLPLAQFAVGCPDHPLGYEARARTAAIATALVAGTVNDTEVATWSPCDIYWSDDTSGMWWELPL